jgi:hypothetical protein
MNWSVNKIIAVGTAVLLAIGLTVFIVWRVTLAGQVNGQLAAIHTAGLPVNQKEADAYYPAVPDAENAAIKMAEAYEALTNYDDERFRQFAVIKFPPLTNSYSPEELDLISGYVVMNSNALAMVQEAVQLPRCRYPVDLTLGAQALVLHLPEIKKLTQLAYFDACLNPGHAAEDIDTMVGVARTLDAEPIIISKLVRVSIVAMAVDACELRLNREGLSDQELVRLGRRFDGLDMTNQMVNGFIGERAMMARYFRMSWKDIKRFSQNADDDSSGNSPMPSSDSQPGFIKATGVFERDLNFYLYAMQTNIMLAEKFPKNVMQISNAQDYIETTARKNYYIFSMMLLPALGSAVMREAVEVAQVRMAETSLAVERYRLANGRLPESLEKLVPAYLPAVPQDPCDGKLLRFRLLEKGYLIYSVGKDGMDNGGVARPRDAKSSDKTPYDVTFRVER